MTDQILPALLSAATIAVLWLAGSKRSEAWIVGLAAQVLWAVWAVSIGAWLLLPQIPAIAFVYARNLRKWRREQRKAAAAPTDSERSDTP